MLSEEQERHVRSEIRACVELLIANHFNTYQLSSLTGIAQSTVHRRVTDYRRIKDIYIKLGKTSEEVDEIIAEIKRLMELNKEQGLSNGGKTFQERYNMERDEEGHFVSPSKKK